MSSPLTSVFLPIVQLVVSVALVPVQLLLHLLALAERALKPTRLTDNKVVVITGANSGTNNRLSVKGTTSKSVVRQLLSA